MYLPVTIIAVLAIVGNSFIPHRYTPVCNLLACAAIVLDYYII